MAFVNSGILRSFYTNPNGNHITYQFHLPNSHVTAKHSFVSQTPSTLSIQVIVPTVLFVINFHDLQELYKSNPVFQEAGRLVTEFSYSVNKKSSILNSTDSVKDKYMFIIENYPQLIKHVPTAHIASYLGVSRETLSRIKNQLLKSELKSF